jgi:hypothetical protein
VPWRWSDPSLAQLTESASAFDGHSWRERFINGQDRTMTIVVCGQIFWLQLIGIAHIHSGSSRALFACGALGVFVIGVRAGFSYVLILEPHQLTSRSLTRTRSWKYSELRSAAAVVDTARARRHRSIVLTSKSGQLYKVTSFRDTPDSPHVIDAAVREINACIFYSDFYSNFSG